MTVTVDAQAFTAFVTAHRSELHRHCRRILRSPERAEDALQEALLRAWRARAEFGGRSTLRTWLHRIATHACIDELRRSGRAPVPLDDDVPDPPGPAAGAALEAREALEFALVAIMAQLAPRQRAVLVVRGLLDYPAEETARLLGTTVPAVNSALQRARATARAAPPEPGQPDPATAAVLRAYVDAVAAHDVARVVEVARRDAGRLPGLVERDAVQHEARLQVPRDVPVPAGDGGRRRGPGEQLLGRDPGEPVLGVPPARPEQPRPTPVAVVVADRGDDGVADEDRRVVGEVQPQAGEQRREIVPRAQDVLGEPGEPSVVGTVPGRPCAAGGTGREREQAQQAAPTEHSVRATVRG